MHPQLSTAKTGPQPNERFRHGRAARRIMQLGDLTLRKYSSQWGVNPPTDHGHRQCGNQLGAVLNVGSERPRECA
jgi:hypothetical protein